MDTSLSQKNTGISRVNPKQFNLWLFIVSIIMIFAALTSALIVKKTKGNWLDITIPSGFLVNTGIILLSSVSMQWAYVVSKRSKELSTKIGLLITFLLGSAFLAGQYMAWLQLQENDIFLQGNASGSFLYIITGVHAFHIIAGLVFVLIILGLTLYKKPFSKNLQAIKMCNTFWHFLGALWIYLYLFFIYIY